MKRQQKHNKTSQEGGAAGAFFFQNLNCLRLFDQKRPNVKKMTKKWRINFRLFGKNAEWETSCWSLSLELKIVWLKRRPT